MSGADQERKMKRKRKTRAERNQMSRHHLQCQEKQSKSTKGLKDLEPSHSTIYALRSGRSSYPLLGLRDDRKANTGTITQGRLTRSLGKLTFTNSKTSDWIKRGPISESKAMKEKVENDIKRILRLAERSTLTSNPDLLQDADNAAQEMDKAVEPEPDVMEVDCPANNSIAVAKSKTETSHQAYTMGAITLPTVTTSTITSVAVQVQVTPVKSGSSFAWATTAPSNIDETLPVEPPVQEIADKILKELKPKFARLFPNRDIEMEVCSDLQKLFNHSCCHSVDMGAADASLNALLPPEYPDPLNLCTPGIVAPSTCTSTLSVCRPISFQTEHFYSQLQHFEDDAKSDSNGSVLIQDSVVYPCLTTYGGTAFHKDVSEAPSFTTAFVVPDLQKVDDVVKLDMTVDESEEDDHDILSTARCNAFLASARELEFERKRLMRQAGTFEGIVPPHASSYHQCMEPDNFLRLSCGHKPEEAPSHSSRDAHSGACSFECRNIRAARVLDFSQPVGKHQHQTAAFSCPSRNASDSLFPNVHLVHPVRTHGKNQLHYLLNNASTEQTQCSFVAQSCSPDSSRFFYDTAKRFSCPETCSSSVSGYRKRSTAANVGPSLAQSRQNFQNALKFACSPDGGHHLKPTEVMDTDRCDDFISSIQRKKTSSPQSCDLLGCRYLMARPLSELKGHQADLQRQARDFLDDLNRCGAKPRLDFINCQPSHNRHLFQMASPDSNGSPVWGMLPAMKDFG